MTKINEWLSEATMNTKIIEGDIGLGSNKLYSGIPKINDEYRGDLGSSGTGGGSIVGSGVIGETPTTPTPTPKVPFQNDVIKTPQTQTQTQTANIGLYLIGGIIIYNLFFKRD